MAVFSHIVDVVTKAAQDNMEAAARAAERMKREFYEGDKAATKLGESAGRVGSSAGKLAGVLDRVSPELAEVARLTADGADAFEVASQGGSTFLNVLGRVLAVLGPVAVAVGVLGGAYFTLKQRLDAANRAMETAAQRADTMADAHSKLREQALLAAVATGELSEAEFNRIAAAKTAEELFAVQRQDQRERLQGTREEIRVLQEQRAETEELIKTLKDAKQRREGVSLAGEGGILSGQQLVTTDERLKQAQQRLAGLNESLQQQANEARTAATALGVLSAATERYADDLVTVENSTLSAKEVLEETTAAAFTLADAFAVLDRTTAAQVTDLTQAGIGIDVSGAGPDSFEERIARLQRTREIREQLAAAPGTEDDPRFPGIAQGVSTGLSALSNPTGALGLLGPAGGILSGLAGIGNIGAEGVEERLDALKDGLVGGVAALPEIIGEVLPDFIAALVTELPPAIARALAEILRNLFTGSGDKDGDGEIFVAEEAQAVSEVRAEQAEQRARDPFATQTSAARTSAGRAATIGRMERARGAARLAIAQSPTQRGAGGGVTIQVQQLGPADPTQAEYLRKLARLQSSTTGLRG